MSLSNLTEEERRDTELKKQAYLLKFKYVRRIIDRKYINDIIRCIDESEREVFRKYINEAKGF